MKRLFKKQINKRPNKKRRFLVGLILLVLALLVGVVVARNLKKDDVPFLCKGEASSPIYEEAAKMTSRSLVISDDHDLVESIQADKGVGSDINCIYPLIVYNIRVKNEQRVKELFNIFSEKYGDKKTDGKIYEGYNVKSYKAVETQVNDFLKGDDSELIFY